MIGKPFCPKCGREGTWGLCENCRSARKKNIEIKACERCKHYLDRGRWKAFVSLEDLNRAFVARGLTIRFKKTTCDPCTKFLGGYYEALIQLRTKKEDVFELLRKKLDELQSQDRYAFYRVKPRKEGIDVEVGSKAAANKAIRALATFHLKMKKSFRDMFKRGRRLRRHVYVLLD